MQLALSACCIISWPASPCMLLLNSQSNLPVPFKQLATLHSSNPLVQTTVSAPSDTCLQQFLPRMLSNPTDSKMKQQQPRKQECRLLRDQHPAPQLSTPSEPLLQQQQQHPAGFEVTQKQPPAQRDSPDRMATAHCSSTDVSKPSSPLSHAHLSKGAHAPTAAWYKRWSTTDVRHPSTDVSTPRGPPAQQLSTSAQTHDLSTAWYRPWSGTDAHDSSTDVTSVRPPKCLRITSAQARTWLLAALPHAKP